MTERRFGRLPGHLAFGGVVLAAGVIAVLSLLNIGRWSAEPIFGYVVRTTARAATIGQVLGPGMDSGLHVGDRIVAVNGQAVSSLGEIRQLRDPRIGSRNAYVIERESRRFEVTIPTTLLGPRAAIFLFGVPWAVGLVFIGLGVTVFLMRPQRGPAWAFLLFSFVTGVFIIFLYRGVLIPSWLNAVSMASLAFLPAAILHLALTVPEDRTRLVGGLAGVVVPYLLSLGLALLLTSSSPIWEDVSLPLKTLWLFYLCVAVCVLLGATGYTHWAAVSAISRLRARVILLGFGIATLVPVGESLMNAVFDAYLLPHTSWLLPFFVFVPLSVGYAIVKHNLFDLDRIIRQTTGYLLLTGVVVLVYAGLVTLANITFRRWEMARSPVFPLVATLLFVFLFNPLRTLVQDVVDRVFHRTRYDYRQTVKGITEALTSVIALDVVVDLVLETLTRRMFIDPASILLRREEDGCYQVYRAEGERKAEVVGLVLAQESPLLQIVSSRRPCLLVRDTIAEDPRQAARRDACLREFDRLRAMLVIPLVFTGNVIGLLALGEKLSGRSYTAEDLALLMTLADESAIAINNAMAFKRLEDLKITLEERVARRTEELAALNVKLEASNARLQDLDRLKSDFVSDVSHELRTPLTSIKGYVDYLLEGIAGELSPAQKDFLARVRGNTERLTRLINDLLDLARIEAGRVDLHPVRLSPGEVVGEVIDVLRPLASEKGVDLGAEVPAADVFVCADRDKLHQILLNLAHNAVKFTPPGGSVRVVVTPRGDGTVLTTVRDTGEGISPEELPRVFEKFHQVGGTAALQGSGLGLTITQKLVGLHGGTILVESEVGKGTEFAFALPAAGPES